MRGNGWFECFHAPPPEVFLFISQLKVPEFESLLSQKGKQKRNGTFVLMMKLYCDMCVSRRWEPHGCTSLSLCRKGTLQQVHH